MEKHLDRNGFNYESTYRPGHSYSFIPCVRCYAWVSWCSSTFGGLIMRYEIQARTNNCVDGGDWITISYGKNLEQAIEQFRIYLKEVPNHYRPFNIHSKIKVYNRTEQRFVADYYI